MPLSNINILILCENERSAQLDRRSLRDCGFSQVHIMTSGIEAARLLADEDNNDEQKPDLVLCHEQLADMRYDQFYAIIRSHPRLLHFPVLMITSSGKDIGLDLNKLEFCDILLRPFSLESLRKKISALLLRTQQSDAQEAQESNVDDSAFQKALASYGLLLRKEHSTDDYFHMGMDFLKERNWSLAISAFQKSVRDHKLKAEAELGMAAAYKGHNDLINFRQSLANAAQSFVRSGRWNRGRSAYARLLQHDRSAKNPFLMEAHRLIRLGDYQKAAEIIQESLPLIPRGRAGAKLAQLCFMAEDQEAMLKAFDSVLVSSGMDILKSEISSQLDILNREKDERERQKNAERKWEMKRRVSLAQAEEEKRRQTLVLDHPELREEEKIALLDDDYESSAEDYLEDDPEDGAEPKKSPSGQKGQMIAPLTRPEATSELFAKKPKFNEFLSVVKLTWKLARRSKKNDKE